MRILFMGTPDFAVPSLEALIEAGHQVCGVFTQPDRPKNRGMKLLPPPVKVCAQSHDIPVYQPTKLRDGTALALIQELAPELIVVAAYGRILPDDILAAPPKGCINVRTRRRRSSIPVLPIWAPSCWCRWCPTWPPVPPPGHLRITAKPLWLPCCPRSCLPWTGIVPPSSFITRSGA